MPNQDHAALYQVKAPMAAAVLAGLFAWTAVSAAGLSVAVAMMAGNHLVTHSYAASFPSSCGARCTH
jgi:hypothetical protein